MSAKLLEGVPVAELVLGEVRNRAARLLSRGIRPGLATVLVGDDPASAGYVRKKHAACAECGFHSENIHLPVSTTQEELHRTLRDLNEDERIHGVLIQHPLPPHLELARAPLAGC